MPLVIYGLGGIHTHTHTHTFADGSDYEKPAGWLLPCDQEPEQYDPIKEQVLMFYHPKPGVCVNILHL